MIHEQSKDISQGVDRGLKRNRCRRSRYDVSAMPLRKTDNYMPLALDISHKILQVCDLEGLGIV